MLFASLVGLRNSSAASRDCAHSDRPGKQKRLRLDRRRDFKTRSRITGLEQLEERSLLSGFNFADFSSTSGLSIVGTASATVDGRLRLTPAAAAQEGGAWYTAEKQFAGLAFESSFQFQFSENFGPPGGSSGFVFIIQNTAPTYLAGSGGGLGYNGLKNSLAVEFDISQENTLGDASQSHISVHTN